MVLPEIRAFAPLSSVLGIFCAVFVSIAVIITSPPCHCQNLHLRGFSGSLYDRIVNNYAPTLGVNPSLLGVTEAPRPQQAGLHNHGGGGISQFPQPRHLQASQGFANSIGNVAGNQQQQQPFGSSQQSQQQLLLANLISQYQQQQNPDVKAQFRGEIERLLAQTSQPPAAANTDPATRLLPYLNFLNSASRNQGVASQLLAQLQRQAALTSTTTTTSTTPSPAQSLFAQAARNPALLQQLLSIARLQQAQATTTSTTTAPPTTPYWLTTASTTTTMRPTMPPAPATSFPASYYLFQQWLAATSTTTTTTTTTPAPTTVAPSTSTTPATVPQLPSDFSKNPALYHEFLQFLQQKQATATLPVVENIVDRTSSTTPATTSTDTAITAAATEAPAIASPEAEKPVSVGSGNEERQILKHVLSKVLDSLLEEERTAVGSTTTIFSNPQMTVASDLPQTTTTASPTISYYVSPAQETITLEPFDRVDQFQSSTPAPTPDPIPVTTTDPESLFSQLLALSDNGHIGRAEPQSEPARLFIQPEFTTPASNTAAPTAITTTDAESLFSQLLALSGVTAANAKENNNNPANQNVAITAPHLQSTANAAGHYVHNNAQRTTQLPTTNRALSPDQPTFVNQGQQKNIPGDLWNNEFNALTRMQQWAQNQALLKQFEEQRQLVLNSSRGTGPTPTAPKAETSTWRPVETPSTARPDAIQQRASDSSSGQYSFSYVGKDSAKEETRDPNGNVRGSYLYVDSNNQVQKVSYLGNEQGFQVTNSNSPKSNAVMDTPEVAAAKQAHFKEVAKIKAEQARRQALKELIVAAAQTSG